MFRKMFRPQGSSKKSLSVSSISGESELVSPAEIAAAEPQFVPNSLEIGSPDRDTSAATLDPFDRKKLGKSRSFSFQFQNKDRSFKVPRSKSVHFEDDLEISPRAKDRKKMFIKPILSRPFSPEKRARVLKEQEEPPEATSSSVYSDDEASSDGKRERVAANLENHFLGSLFEDAFFDDADTIGSHTKDGSPLYDIYTKVCGLVELDVQPEYAFDQPQLLHLILSGIADIAERMQQEKSRYIEAKVELKRLSGQIEQISSAELDSSKSRSEMEQRLVSQQKKIAELNKALAEKEADSRASKCVLQQEINSLLQEKQRAEAANAKQIADNDAKWNKEKEKLTYLVLSTREKADETTEFLNEEITMQRESNLELRSKCDVLELRNTELDIQLEASKLQFEDKARLLETKAREVEELVVSNRISHDKLAAKDQERMRKQAELELRLAEEEKAKRVSDEERNAALALQEDNRVKINSLTLQLQSVTAAFNKIKKEQAVSSSKEAERVKELHELKTSNQIAVEVFKKMVKGNFESLVSVFQAESAEQFTQTYYDFARLRYYTKSSQETATILCNFLLMTTRELVHQHSKNEQMLQTEIQDRLKYQGQVLNTFQRIAAQILSSNRKSGPRLSPRKKKTAPKVTESIIEEKVT